MSTKTSNSKRLTFTCRFLKIFEGQACGLDQPTMICELAIPPISSREIANFDKAMARLLSDSESLPVQTTTDHIQALAERIHFWSAALQLELNIPVFGPCHVSRQVPGEGNSSNRKYTKCDLAVPYVNPFATRNAVFWAVRVFNSVFDLLPTGRGVKKPNLAMELDQLRKSLKNHTRTGTNTIHFLRAAHELRIPYQALAGKTYCYGFGVNSRWLDSSMTDQDIAMGVKLARDKFFTTKILAKYLMPVPRHNLVSNEDEASLVADKLAYPVVVKPSDQDQGRGVFAGLKTEQSLRAAYRAAREISNNILVEKHYSGEDYRFTVFRGRVIKIMHRKPGGIIGDGKSTVAQLMRASQSLQKLRRSFRSTGKYRLELDAEALELLAEQNLTTDSVPADQQFVLLRRKSNISTGGTAQVVPVDEVHTDNCELAIRAASVFRLDIAGIDLILRDASRSWRQSGGIICEVNAQPQIGHSHTPHIFKEILMETVPEGGQIPLHLFLSVNTPNSSLINERSRLFTEFGCNGFSSAAGFWISGVQRGWSPQSSFHAARGMLLDRELSSGIVVMTANDVLKFGLPALKFSSFRLLEPVPLQDNSNDLQQAVQFITNHSGLSPVNTFPEDLSIACPDMP